MEANRKETTENHCNASHRGKGKISAGGRLVRLDLDLKGRGKGMVRGEGKCQERAKKKSILEEEKKKKNLIRRKKGGKKAHETY